MEIPPIYCCDFDFWLRDRIFSLHLINAVSIKTGSKLVVAIPVLLLFRRIKNMNSTELYLTG